VKEEVVDYQINTPFNFKDVNRSGIIYYDFKHNKI
jgi:hypothetical protein